MVKNVALHITGTEYIHVELSPLKVLFAATFCSRINRSVYTFIKSLELTVDLQQELLLRNFMSQGDLDPLTNVQGKT